ncbi:hypothetical protein Tco_0761748 [Tanacetum coccineum]
MVEGSKNVIDDSLHPRNDEPKIPGTRLEPRSDKESMEVEITNNEEVEITNVVILVNVNEEEEEITDEVSPRTLITNLVPWILEETLGIDAKLASVQYNNKNFFQELQGRYTYLFEHLKERFLSRKSFDTLADHLQEVRDQVLVYVAEGLILERQKTKEEMERMIAKAILQKDQDDPNDDAYPLPTSPPPHQPPPPLRRENSAKRQKTSEYEAYVSGESSSGQVNEEERGPSTLGNQEQVDDYDFWTDSYASDDDEILMKQVSQDIMEEKGSSGPEKIILSLHKFPAIIFNDDDIEERTSRWIVARRANDCIISITEPDYKNLNKNDIKDIYLLITNSKVPNYAETGLLWSLSVFIRSSVTWERVHDFQLGIESYKQKVNRTAPTISFPGIEKHKMFSIIYEPVHGIIYKNSKKEKRVMRHSEIHKFCDATLNRVLEEDIEVRLKYRNQMRRWEMYVNGRPVAPRRECPE